MSPGYFHSDSNYWIKRHRWRIQEALNKAMILNSPNPVSRHRLLSEWNLAAAVFGFRLAHGM
jgi:hypothetical protein